MYFFLHFEARYNSWTSIHFTFLTLDVNKIPDSTENEVYVFCVPSADMVQELERAMQKNLNNFGLACLLPIDSDPVKYLMVFQKAQHIHTYAIFGDKNIKVKAMNEVSALESSPINKYSLNYFIGTINCYLPNYHVFIDKLQ